jgi:hypothetical protein
MVLQSIFKATFMYTNPFLVLSPLEVSEPPTRACTEWIIRKSSNQCSLSYPALKYETQYKFPRQLILRVCGVLLSERTDEDEVFAKRAAQMHD